ncbi:MAG: hypothetical protein CMN78_01215 [Spirochaetales bacterium]|nr:hypothetical protein [Spirochaetales bacterium]
MREKYQKYLKVLKIELEDLEEDLLLMAKIYQQREANNEITDYVFLENLTLLQSEISGIEQILKSIDTIDVDSFKTLDEMVEHVDVEFREKTEKSNFPEAVYALVKRKLSKVSAYIHSDDENS